MTILDLPPELSSKIFNVLVSSYGLEEAVQARLVCRFFDQAIEEAIWATKAVEERTGNYLAKTGRELVGDYAFRCILAGDKRCHDLKQLIFEALESLNDGTPSGIPANADPVRAACRAWMRQRFDWFFGTCLKPVGIDLNVCTPDENALAIAACAGWELTVQKLIENGVRDAHTLFGYPLEELARHGTPLLASQYLTSRLKVPQVPCRCAQPCTFKWTLGANPNIGEGHIGTWDRGWGPRNISHRRYEDAIVNAIRGNNPETMKVLFDAAEEEGQLDRILPPSGAWRESDHVGTILQSQMLSEAIKWQRFDIVKTLLHNGACPTKGLRNCALIADREHLPRPWNPMMTSLFLGYGGNPDSCPAGSLLAHAICHNHEPCVRMCLKAGTEYSRTELGRRRRKNHPLWYAAVYCKNVKMLRLLLENGITFDIGSELDHGLPPYAPAWDYMDDEESDSEAKAEILEILQSYRKAQSSTQALEAGQST